MKHTSSRHEVRFIVSFLFNITFLSILSTQPPIEWQKSLGGSDLDEAYSVQQTSDGGYIAAGKTKSIDGDVTCHAGGQDVWIVKMNAVGEIDWQQCLLDVNFEVGYSIQQTIDEGYIVSGSTDEFSSNDFLVAKLLPNGEIAWAKVHGGTGSENIYSIQQTPDGGFIAAGESDSNDGDVSGNKGLFDIWIVKLDSVGEIQWEKSIGGSQDDRANAVRVAEDGGYFIGGQTFSSDGDVTDLAGVNDFWIIKLDSAGNIEWQNTLGGSLFDEAMTIEPTTDGGVIAAGYSYSNDSDVTENKGAQDVWITKLDRDGQLEWQKSFGGTVDDIVFGIAQSADGSFIAAGGTSTQNNGDITGNHGKWDFWLLKLDDAGNLIWQQTYGGSNFDVAYSIEETADEGYVVAGYTNSTDGDVSNPNGSRDMWIVKLASITGLSNYKYENAFRIYPNPTSGILNIDISRDESWNNIEICDITGNIVYSTSKLETTQIDVSNLTTGIYFIRLKNQNGRFIKIFTTR